MGRSTTSPSPVLSLLSLAAPPLRRFAPPPHEWGGAQLLHYLFFGYGHWRHSPSGASRHLPMNGEDHSPLPTRPFGPTFPASGESKFLRTPLTPTLSPEGRGSSRRRGFLGGGLGGVLVGIAALLPATPLPGRPVSGAGRWPGLLM